MTTAAPSAVLATVEPVFTDAERDSYPAPAHAGSADRFVHAVDPLAVQGAQE